MSFGVFTALMPVAANLHHHAIEMLLKGALSKTMTLKDMKDKPGHKLDRCWREFKKQADDTKLNRFDQVMGNTTGSNTNGKNRKGTEMDDKAMRK